MIAFHSSVTAISNGAGNECREPRITQNGANWGRPMLTSELRWVDNNDTSTVSYFGMLRVNKFDCTPSIFLFKQADEPLDGSWFPSPMGISTTRRADNALQS